MNKITLIIVDCQYDFIDGSLAVPEAYKTVSNIIDFICTNRKNINQIIFTVDWHPINHCSFKDNGGQWPVHCVQYTEGASIDKVLMEAVHKNNLFYSVATKGTCSAEEEYGAFSEHSEGTFVNYSDRYFLSDFDHIIPIQKDSDIIVCGIAGDYCVKETIKNILDLNPKVFLNGIASIDDGSTIKEFVKENNLKVVK